MILNLGVCSKVRLRWNFFFPASSESAVYASVLNKPSPFGSSSELSYSWLIMAFMTITFSENMQSAQGTGRLQDSMTPNTVTMKTGRHLNSESRKSFRKGLSKSCGKMGYLFCQYDWLNLVGIHQSWRLPIPSETITQGSWEREPHPLRTCINLPVWALLEQFPVSRKVISTSSGQVYLPVAAVITMLQDVDLTQNLRVTMPLFNYCSRH